MVNPYSDHAPDGNSAIGGIFVIPREPSSIHYHTYSESTSVITHFSSLLRTCFAFAIDSSLLNLAGDAAQYQRNRCSIWPVLMHSRNGILNQRQENVITIMPYQIYTLEWVFISICSQIKDRMTSIMRQTVWVHVHSLEIRRRISEVLGLCWMIFEHASSLK